MNGRRKPLGPPGDGQYRLGGVSTCFLSEPLGRLKHPRQGRRALAEASETARLARSVSGYTLCDVQLFDELERTTSIQAEPLLCTPHVLSERGACLAIKRLVDYRVEL